MHTSKYILKYVCVYLRRQLEIDFNRSPFHFGRNRSVNLDFRLRSEPEEVMVVAGGPPRGVTDHITKLFHVDEVIIRGIPENNHCLQLVRSTVQKDATDTN